MSTLLTFRRTDYVAQLQAIASPNLIGYWPLNELSGTVSYDQSGQNNNGTYTAVTLAVAGIGNGNTGASFNGSTSKDNVFSSALATDFNRLEGSLALWAKVSAAGVWTDGTVRYLIELNADSQNRISILRSATNGIVTLAYRGGNVLKQVSSAAQSSTDWLHWALTWSVSANAVKAYLNGAQIGTTQTTLTAFTGSLAIALIGVLTVTPTSVWSGSLAHVALFNAALGASQIAALSSR